ncbi:MAG TPA: carboxypeptidase regulatory-like domain-containing protein [Bryobacteraceae bacterium]|nr:carboxypeptidase regulatory-like domain-containing protein [Bryobacteraceae bacterium]
MHIRVPACFLLFLVTSFLPLNAQSNLATILGTAVDASHAPVAAVPVVVTNIDTGQERRFQSTASGDFEINHLQPGRYRVSADAAGFRHFVHEGIVLPAGETVRVNVDLEIDGIAQQITVSEEGTPEIATDSGSLADQRTIEQYRAFPVAQNHEPYTILATLPNFQVAQSQNSSSTYKFSIAGSRTGQSEFQMDGVSAPNNNSPELSASQTMEGTAEVRLQAVNNTAEYGQPGIYQMVSKSGTNELHGSGYYYHSNSALTARDFFAIQKPHSIGHEYGGGLSGPVVIPHLYNGHNRTFFLLAYDGDFNPGQGTRLDSVPSLQFRNGDFSSLKSLKDPLTQQLFPGNQIPASRISPVSAAFQKLFYPLPNTGAPNGLVNNLFTLYPNPGKENIGDVRVDQYLGSKNNFFVRVGARQFPSTRLKTLPTIGNPSILRTFRTLVLADTHVFSPALVNEFRFGQVTTNNTYTDGGQRGLNVIRETGLQGLDGVPDDAGTPIIAITGFASITHNGNNRYFYHDRNRQVTDNMTYIRGRHTIKYGVDVRHQYPDVENVPLGVYGQFSFGGNFTGNPYADFLLGIPQVSTRVPTVPKVQKFQTDWNVFVQDQWKVSSRLTVNAGLRYEYQAPLTESGGLIYNFDPQNGALVVPTAKLNLVSPLFNPAVPIVTAKSVGYPEDGFRNADKNNFAPRVGFAYRLNQRNDFVVRGGYGIYVNNVGNSLLSTYEGGPFSAVAATFNNSLVNGAPQFQFPNPFPAAGPQASNAPPSVNGLNPNLVNPYTQQWNLTVEKQVAGTGLRLSYIGTRSDKLFYLRNINIPAPGATPFSQARRPYPLYGNISFQDNGGISDYHAMQLEASRRFGRDATFNLAWTWASSTSDVEDTGGGVYGTNIQDPNNRANDRGRDGYAVRHRVVGNVIYRLPFGHNQRYLTNLSGIADAALGGWQLIGLGSYQTGLFFTPVYSGVDATGTGITSGRPDRTGSGSLPASQQSIYNWFDKTAFPVPSGAYGNSGRGILEGPPLGVLHLGLGKDFHIREHAVFNLEVSAQNIMNHPNFSLPNATSNNSAGGSISSTVTNLYNAGENGTGARSLQLRGRLTF